MSVTRSIGLLPVVERILSGVSGVKRPLFSGALDRFELLTLLIMTSSLMCIRFFLERAHIYAFIIGI